MLTYAEQHLTGTTDEGKRYLKAYVNDFDTVFERVVRSRGYEKEPGSHRPMSYLVIPHPFPPIRLPDGFRLKSLADDNDLYKVDRVLWRGFNHPGEPPADGPEGRKKMQSGVQKTVHTELLDQALLKPTKATLSKQEVARCQTHSIGSRSGQAT